MRARRRVLGIEFTRISVFGNFKASIRHAASLHAGQTGLSWFSPYLDPILQQDQRLEHGYFLPFFLRAISSDFRYVFYGWEYKTPIDGHFSVLVIPGNAFFPKQFLDFTDLVSIRHSRELVPLCCCS